MKFFLKGLLFIFLFVAVIQSGVLVVNAAGKVSPNPDTVTMDEDGDEQVVEITLDEPIIIPEEGEPLTTINISSDDGRVQVSPTSVTYLSAEWAQTREFTITTTGDEILNPDNEVTITLSVVSDSEYYSGYENTVVVTLIDDEDDITPPETSITSYDTDSSAATFEFSSDEIGATFECSLDESDFVACISPYTTPALLSGEHTFEVRAVDLFENTDASPASHAWNVFDISVEPVLVLHFDETSGSTAYDSSGNDNDGAITGDENWVSGYMNNGFGLDGLGNYLTIDRPVQDDMSICARIKTTSIGNDVYHWQLATILESEVGGLGNDFGFGVDSNGFLAFGNGGLYDGVVNGATTINDDVWHHVCATRSTETGEVNLYVDGSLDANGTTSVSTLDGNGSAYIGNGFDGGAFLGGIIDELYVYDSVLSYSDIVGLSGDTLPTVESVSPADGETDVLVDDVITITFSESMNTDSLIVSTSPCEEECATYDVEWAEDNTVVELTRSNGSFEHSTTYTIEIEAENTDGISLESEYEWSFTTAAPARRTSGSYVHKTVKDQNTIPPILPFIFTKNLKWGMVDGEVKELQKFLNTHGFPVSLSGAGSLGNETTYFGLRTKAAVILFQKAKGLVPDGIVGPKTRAMMMVM